MYKPKQNCVIFHSPDTKVHFRKGYRPFTIIAATQQPYSNSTTPYNPPLTSQPQQQQGQSIITKYSLADLDAQVKGKFPFKVRHVGLDIIITIINYDTIVGAYVCNGGGLYSPLSVEWELVNNTQIMMWHADGAESREPGPLPPKIDKCECGAESIGSSGHSNWCPKHS